jgi:hypothetical protein
MKIKYLIDNLISPNIQALDFVDRYASVVKTINISIGDSVKRYPIACDVTEQDCANNGRYQDLVPDDSKMSVLYWEELQPMQVSGFTPTKTFKNRVFKGSARLIVWVNLAKMGQTSCTTPIEVLLELEKAITQNIQITSGVFQNSRVEILPTRTEGNIDTIFGKYSYPKTKNFYLSPFDFFAIDVSFTITQCLTKGASFVLSPSVDCANGGTVEDACTLLLQRLTTEQKNDCILPSYDFSNPVVQDATTPTQQADLSNWLCTPVNPYSYLLDGINEGFSLTSSTLNALNGFQPYTITSWVRSTNYNLLQYIFSKAVSGSAGYGFYLGSGVVQAGVGGTIGDSAVKRGIIPLTSNTWYHLAVTYNGSGDANGFNFYVDGVLLTNTAIVSNSFSTSTLTSSPVRIGSNNAASSFFSGNICYTRQWGREFTLSDIVSDYHSRVLLPNAIYPLDLIFGFTPSDLDIFANDRWNTKNEAEPNNGFGSSNVEFSKRSTSIPF